MQRRRLFGGLRYERRTALDRVNSRRFRPLDYYVIGLAVVAPAPFGADVRGVKLMGAVPDGDANADVVRAREVASGHARGPNSLDGGAP